MRFSRQDTTALQNGQNIAIAARRLWQWKDRKLKKFLLVFLFLLPAGFNIVIFRYLPLVRAIEVSTKDYSLLRGDNGFVGFEHYINAFADPNFIQSLAVTLKFVVIRVPLLVILGLAVAVFLQESSRLNNTLRTIVLLPTVTSIIVVSVLWTLIYNPSAGLLNGMLDVFGLGPFSYLSDYNNALPAVAIMTIWKDLGLTMLILLAALQNVSVELLESAEVEGAGKFRAFWHITLPTIKPSILLVVVTMTVSSFQLFAPVFAMTQGGPGGTTRISVYYIYQQAFRYSDVGYASALSVMLLILLLMISVFQFVALRSDDQ